MVAVMNALVLTQHALVVIGWIVVSYFVFVNGSYFTLLLTAAWEMRQHVLRTRGESRWRVLNSRVAPTVSMLSPAYNEEMTIAESVRALLTLHYPNLEVVVVNDGSSDRTLDVLKQEFDLQPIHTVVWRRLDTRPIRALYTSRIHPNLTVVDKENGGKADALNAGLNVATGELVCAMDADTLIEADALQRMVRPFLLRDDVMAAGGTIRLVNGSQVRAGRVRATRVPRHPLAGLQVVEYLRAFLFGRLAWNRLGGNLIISGAFGLFRRDPMIAAGGYASDTVGEDMELVMRFRRQAYEDKRPHRVTFIPDPVAWTEAPQNLRVLGRQRDRWHRGLADALWRHKRLFLNPRYGMMGLVVFPFFLLVELLGPVMEAIGLIGLVLALAVGAVSVPFAVAFFLLAYGFGLVVDALTLLLEEFSYHRYEGMMDRIMLMLWSLLESFGYRQLTVYWRLRGLIRFVARRRDWGRMDRRGFAPRQSTQRV